MDDAAAPKLGCLNVCTRADVSDLNADLLGGRSVRWVMRKYGLSLSHVFAHRRDCLGLRGTLPNPDGEPNTFRNVRAKKPNEEPNDPETEGTAEKQAVPVPIPRGKLLALRPSLPRTTTAYACRTEEEQVRFVCELIETNRFYFRATLDRLERIWGLRHEEVRARYEAAISRCSADRQLAMAQLEVSLAALEAQESEAMREFRRLRKSEAGPARGYLALAIKARTEYAELAGLKKMSLDVNINIWTRPEVVMAVDTFTNAAVNALMPAEDAEFEALVARVKAELRSDVDPSVVSAVLAVASREMLRQLKGVAGDDPHEEPEAAAAE